MRANLKKRLEFKKVELKDERRSNSALKGVVTRKKNQLDRVKKGVCPCCNRFFENVHRHMTNKHPDFENK